MKTANLIPGALLLVATTVHADETFRCGQWIANSDMSVSELLSKCGQPDDRQSSTEDVMVRNKHGLMQKTGETRIETWTWDRGPNAAPMVATIVDGRIKSIERGR